jgi:hypothetical protein
MSDGPSTIIVPNDLERRAEQLLGPMWRELFEAAFGDVPGLTLETVLWVVETMELGEPGSGRDWLRRHTNPEDVPRYH